MFCLRFAALLVPSVVGQVAKYKNAVEMFSEFNDKSYGKLKDHVDQEDTLIGEDKETLKTFVQKLGNLLRRKAGILDDEFVSFLVFSLTRPDDDMLFLVS